MGVHGIVLIDKSRIKAVADAYYVLSDPTRRKEYDILYVSRSKQEMPPNADASSFFSQFASMFGSSAAGAGATPGERPNADNVFADAFEEVLLFSL